MPYATNQDLPPYIKKYGDKVQSQWRHVFNTVYNSTNDEKRAFMAANAVLKKRFTGKDSMEKNSRHDHINMLVDVFLKNLEG